MLGGGVPPCLNVRITDPPSGHATAKRITRYSRYKRVCLDGNYHATALRVIRP